VRRRQQASDSQDKVVTISQHSDANTALCDSAATRAGQLQIAQISPQFQDELDKTVNIAEERKIRSNIG
jgi:hypothetical protein